MMLKGETVTACCTVITRKLAEGLQGKTEELGETREDGLLSRKDKCNDSVRSSKKIFVFPLVLF